MIDPGTAMLFGSGLSALGGLFGGGQGKQTKEQKREFDIQSAPNIARLLEGAPLRDKLMAIMGNVAGHPPQQFQGRDYFNPSMNPSGRVQLGGRDPSSLGTPAGYQDGSGPMQELYKKILGQMGYNQFATPSAGAPGPVPPGGTVNGGPGVGGPVGGGPAGRGTTPGGAPCVNTPWGCIQTGLRAV